MAFPPNAELVAVYWLKGVTGLNADLVATTLPAPNDSFAASGFVQATVVGGVPNNHTPMQSTAVQVDCWAYNANSNKAPWGKAATLAAYIKQDIEERNPARLLDLPANFDNAFVHSVIVDLDPRRVPDDESFARYSLDLRLFWTRRASA